MKLIDPKKPTHPQILMYLQLHTKKKTRRKLRKIAHCLCSECNGKGLVKKRSPKMRWMKTWPAHKIQLCSRCLGSGFYDWIHEITGPKRTLW